MAELTQGAAPMTREEKKKWLMRVTRVKSEIIELEEMRKTSLERATAITASYSKAAAGGGADPHKFDPLAMAGEIIDNRIRDLQTAIAETLLVINNIEETENMSVKRKILILRYIRGMEWDEIAKRIHYSERHAKRMMDDAIDHLIIPMELAEGEKESAKEQTCHGMS